MSKNNKKDNKNEVKSSENVLNATVHSVIENGFYNLSIDVGDIKGVKVRLLVPNVKLSCKIHHTVNKK